jgi:hypothetical protein
MKVSSYSLLLKELGERGFDCERLCDVDLPRTILLA